MQFEPPSGYPLGTNKTFKYAAAIVVPILKILTKREWRGAENLPKTGPVIVISNHLSYADALLFAHFLYGNGRAVRYLGKDSVFRIPILGKIILSAGQIPVARESDKASHALDSALGLLQAGHCVGIYPEGTLTRDAKLWPMVAKTGAARLAIITQLPIIPVAAWGIGDVLPPYSKLPRIWKRSKITLRAGKPIDMSRWYGKQDDPVALAQATAYIMGELTTMLEDIRGEKRPADIFDPHTSDLPRTGNFKRKR